MKHVVIYTDGACRGNPGMGGFAAVLQYGEHQKIVSGYEAMTTNNRMELTAAVCGLEALSARCQVDLYTDSKYVQQGMASWIKKWHQNGWKRADKGAVKNVDLWQKLHALTEQHDITWHWVKGHSGHLGNELADSMANQAIDKALRG